jgi:hypothetical protein
LDREDLNSNTLEKREGSGSAEPEFDFEEPLFQHGDAPGKRGVEIGLVSLDFAEAQSVRLIERREAAQKFTLHVAHFLDEPVFHGDQVLLEVLL